jgi:hypothetical protein
MHKRISVASSQDTDDEESKAILNSECQTIAFSLGIDVCRLMAQ